jgi:hypothetical protein
MTRPFKIPASERAALIERYIEGGSAAIAEECARLGVERSYIPRAAWHAGLTRRKSNPHVSLIQQCDPRWDRAKAVGAINV